MCPNDIVGAASYMNTILGKFVSYNSPGGALAGYGLNTKPMSSCLISSVAGTRRAKRYKGVAC